ncbi:MAG: hypothetical protein NVS3B5_21680 [Sphingomicrobium sp.]
MAGFKVPDFAERAALARAAKERALEKLRAKPAPDPAQLEAQRAAAEAKEAAAAEKRAAKQQALAEAKVAKEAERAQREAAQAAAAKPLTPEEQRRFAMLVTLRARPAGDDRAPQQERP